MTQALVPVFGRRPPFVTVHPGASAMHWFADGRAMEGQHGPVTLALSVHDAWYRRTLASWKRLVGKRGPGWRETIARYRRWRERQRVWYAAHGELPPDRVVLSGQPRRLTCRKGHAWGAHDVRVRKGRRERRCRICERERLARRRSDAGRGH